MNKTISIAKLNKEDLDSYFSFIESRYKTEEEKAKKRTNIFLRNEEIRNNTFVVFNDAGQIVGNQICKPTDIYVDGNLLKGYKYVDYYVKEEYRKSYAGIKLLKTALKNASPAISVNVLDKASKISTYLNAPFLGDIYKFIWLNSYSPLWKTLKFFLEKDKIYPDSSGKELAAPEFIYFGNKTFRLLKDTNEISCLLTTNYLLKGLEFKRTLEDIKYQIEKKNYMFYYLINSNPPIYFSLRRINYKGLDLLDILDFRTPVEDLYYFQLILKSVKKLAKINGIDGVLCWNSLFNFETILRKNWFIKIGKPINISSNIKISSANGRIPLFATIFDDENYFI